jgi:ComF family protein
MQRAGCEGLCKLTYYRPHQSAPPQNRMIFRIKHQNDRRTFLYLGEELVPVIRARLAEMQIPTESVILTHLPRMQRTVLRRGVDQAEELAKVLSELLAIPHRKLILRNHHSDREQKGLSAAEREKNAKRAFLPSRREDCRGRTVLLIDDVVTTGAGMAAGTRLLRRMKAERVIAVTVAMDASNRDADGARV